MPRYSVTGSTPDWPGLHRLLYEQQGYFTAAQAHGHSISPALLRYHVDSGAFERVMRGVYRLSTFPPTPAEDLVVFWLWSDRHGVFSHATALLQHRLSDALPGSTCMTVPPHGEAVASKCHPDCTFTMRTCPLGLTSGLTVCP